jgi:phosphoglycerol geranylgeranyltransferase
MGYIIVGEGSAASIVGHAFPIPFDRPELAVAHALAAQYLGMRFVYLEAGSGAKRSVPPTMVQAVKGVISIPLVVGGGIRTGRQAKEIAEAGADMLVTGNITEKSNSENYLKELISNVRRE